MNKPIDMKELLNKLNEISDIGGPGNDKNVVHASSTRALAEDIVAHAKAIAEQNGIDISDDKGSQIWDGIMMRQLSDAIQGLKDYVSEARTDAEYLAGQDDRAREMNNDV